MLLRHNGARGLQARLSGSFHQLFENQSVVRYSNPHAELALDPESFAVLETKFSTDRVEGNLVQPHHLGSMIILHRSFAESMPEYPLVEAEPEWLITSESPIQHCPDPHSNSVVKNTIKGLPQLREFHRERERERNMVFREF